MDSLLLKYNSSTFVDKKVEESDSLKVVMKNTSYRVKSIEVKRSDAIDQIKITYDDATVWYIGHDRGKSDARKAIMTRGEYIVRVTHERFVNYKSAGAAVEFETNKRRIFSYQPLSMATKWKSELTTVQASHGNEIIGLIIKHGVLVGTEQQPVPADELLVHSKQWYVIASYLLKETGDDDIKSNNEEMTSDDILYQHFFCRSDALKCWKDTVLDMKKKKGRGAIYVDCMQLKVPNKTGNEYSIKKCIERAETSGFCAAKCEEDATVIDVLKKLMGVMKEKKDIWFLMLFIIFHAMTAHFNIESQLLKGDMVTLIVSNQTTTKANKYTDILRRYIMNFNGVYLDESKAAIVTYFFLKILSEIIQWSSFYIQRHVLEAKNTEMELRAFNKVLSLDQAYFDVNTTSEIRNSINVRSLNLLLTEQIPRVVGSAIAIVMATYYLLSISFQLGIITLLGLIAIKVLVLDTFENLLSNLNKISRKVRQMDGQISSNVLSMLQIVKLFSKEDYHVKEYALAKQRTLLNRKKESLMRSMNYFSYDTCVTTLSCIVLFFSVASVKQSHLSAGELTGLVFLLNQILMRFRIIKFFLEWIVQEFPDIDRFVRLMETKSQTVSGSNLLDTVQSSITFANVSFSYPSRPGEMVLSDLNLTIQVGKMTAIVGDSGAGKSTIAKLIMRLYDPKFGAVLIDGQDLREIDISSLHEKIAMVTQNPDLFDLSLADNIAYGKTNFGITESELQNAVELSNCGFISKFRGGFDLFPGSRGNHLSGGQKQRIAIARTAIRNPKVLILDEATSSLDAENEKLVQEALENIMEGRTIIVIAHRLSTVKNSDEIICMKDGKVAERGTHEELMTKEGVYYNLVCKQLTEKIGHE